MQNDEIVEFGSTGTVPKPPRHPCAELKSVPDPGTGWPNTLEPLRRAGAGKR